MNEWEQSLSQKLTVQSDSEFNCIESGDINAASELDYGCSGIYMEATVIYFDIKNINYLLKEHGRRKAALAYTMYQEVLSAIAERTGGFVNCFNYDSFLIVYPGKEESIKQGVIGALNIVHMLTENFKKHFESVSGLEFGMGIDHGHILGTKTHSDNGQEHLTWYGTCILKAQRICKECARPFYVGIAGIIYHSLDDDLRITTRRILGIKKNVEIWNKVTYQYENVKKHLYQTNHKISMDEA